MAKISADLEVRFWALPRDWLAAWVAYWATRVFHRRAVWYVIKPPIDEKRLDPALADCPFPSCDHHGGMVLTWRGSYTGHWSYAAFCNSCNATGPLQSTPEDAARCWNGASRL